MSARWRRAPAPVYRTKPEPLIFAPALEVEQAEAGTDLPVRGPLPGGQGLAPGSNHRVVVGACAVRHLVARGVRDEQQVRLDGRLDERELRIEGCDPLAELGEGRLAGLGLGGLAGPDVLPHLAAAFVPLVLDRVRLGQQLAPAGIGFQQSVDDLRTLALAGDRALDGVRVVADGLDRDHEDPLVTLLR